MDAAPKAPPSGRQGTPKHHATGHAEMVEVQFSHKDLITRPMGHPWNPLNINS